MAVEARGNRPVCAFVSTAAVGRQVLTDGKDDPAMPSRGSAIRSSSCATSLSSPHAARGSSSRFSRPSSSGSPRCPFPTLPRKREGVWRRSSPRATTDRHSTSTALRSACPSPSRRRSTPSPPMSPTCRCRPTRPRERGSACRQAARWSGSPGRAIRTTRATGSARSRSPISCRCCRCRSPFVSLHTTCAKRIGDFGELHRHRAPAG